MCCHLQPTLAPCGFHCLLSDKNCNGYSGLIVITHPFQGYMNSLLSALNNFHFSAASFYPPPLLPPSPSYLSRDVLSFLQHCWVAIATSRKVEPVEDRNFTCCFILRVTSEDHGRVSVFFQARNFMTGAWSCATKAISVKLARASHLCSYAH